MTLSVGLSAYLNNFSQPLAADIGLHAFVKRVYGKLIPFYRLRLGGECAASNAGLTLLGPEIPVVRAQAAIDRIEHTYAADAAEGEAFTDWVCRKQLPFFTELLDDFLQVSPSDLPELLADFAGKQDFVTIMMDATPTETEQHDQVSALLDEAQNEQRFRNSLQQDGELRQVQACNQNILDLAAKAVIHARGGLLMIEGELLLPLTRALPQREDLTDGFAQLQQSLLLDVTASIELLNQRVDEWLSAAQQECESRQQLRASSVFDLTRESAPLAFLKLKQSVQNGNAVNAIKLANSDAAEAIINGLKTIGVELVSRALAAQDDHVVLVLKKIEGNAGEVNSVH